MKRCPACQATFGDEKRFCQVDGTPLVEVVETVAPEDPFKTIVGTPPPTTSPNISDDVMKTFVVNSESRNEDILQIPEEFDPMKTVVSSGPMNFDRPSTPINEPVVPIPEPPKFSEPNLSPPIFNDLAAPEAPTIIGQPPRADSLVSTPISEPPKIEAPLGIPFTPPPTMVETPKFGSNPLPSESPLNDSPFDQPMNAPIPSPFDQPLNPPTINEPQPMKANEPKPFGNSPFETPASPFSQQNDPFNQPVQQQEAPWNPPPAPIQSWPNQGVGANTPFQPPVMGAGGQNQTLPIISLILGIISLCCYIGWLTGPAALITGFIGIKNVKKDPTNYGGKGLAIAGMIVGGLFTVLWVLYWVFIILVYAGIIGASFLNR